MTIELQWTTTTDGVLVGANFHDGSLCGLNYSDVGGIVFTIRSLAGEEYTLKLSGLQDFTIAELWNGAIINDFCVWDLTAVPEDAWTLGDGAWNVLFKNRMRRPDALKRVEQLRELNPKRLLVQMSCSYGGSLVAVCTDVTLQLLSS